MAIDALARGMAAAAGGGGGGVDVGIDAGTGIRFTGTDPITIINTGVTAVTTPGDNDVAEDGTIKVANPGAENSADRVHYVKVKGINNAAFKDVDTVINDTKATSTNVPTTKAVYDELEKKLEADLDTTTFTNDNDHVPSSKLVKEKLDDKLEDSLTINGVSYDSANDSYTLDGDDIDLTGYTPISSGAEEDVVATDSVNDAVAKIEYKADNRIPTDNIDTDFPVNPDADHVLASTIASATFQGTGTVGVAPKKGLVPAPSTTSGTETRYLKADGTWATPPNSEYSEGTGIDIDNAGVITNTGVTHIENSDPADDNVGNGTFKVTENGTDKWIAIKGLDDAAYMEVVTSIPATPLDTDLPTSQAVAEYVDDAIEALPKPMVFKGGITLTADSTDTTLCSLTLPSGITTIKEGYTFKVVAIASSPVYTGNIKVGDTLYADKDNAKTTADWVVDTDWTITPSGDEPSGTVTEITASDGIIAYDNATHGSSISDNGNIKLALVTNHTTTANAGDASSTADRSYPLALDGNGKLATNVPWTDTKVTQTNDTTTTDYLEVLLANTTGTTTEVSGVKKSSLDYKPSTGELRATKFTGVGGDTTLDSSYAEASAEADIASTDKVNEALGKLEYKVDNRVKSVEASSLASGTGVKVLASYNNTTRRISLKNIVVS